MESLFISEQQLCVYWVVGCDGFVYSPVSLAFDKVSYDQSFAVLSREQRGQLTASERRDGYAMFESR